MSLSGLWEALHVPFYAIDWYTRPVASVAGMDGVTLRFLVGLLLAYALALAHRPLKSALARHLSALLGGMALLYFVYGPIGVAHHLLMGGGAYVLHGLLRLFSSSSLSLFSSFFLLPDGVISVLIGLSIHVLFPFWRWRNNPNLAIPEQLSPGFSGLLLLSPVKAAYAVFVYAFAYLSAMHIERAWFHTIEEAAGADPTAGLMMLSIKLTTLAFNYMDHLTPEQALLPEWRPHVLSSLPSPLAFFSYVFYFGGVLAGPPSVFKDYAAFIDLSLFPNKVLPSAGLQTLSRLGKVLMCFAIHKAVDMAFPAVVMYTMQYRSYSAPYQLFFVVMAALGMRFKYYTVWILAEGSNDLTGLGWLGLDDKGKNLWGRIDMIHVLDVEFGNNPRSAIAAWNIQASNWFRSYIYYRLAPPNSSGPKWLSTVASLATMMLSAFWHGFYPSYYVFFALAFLVGQGARVVRSKIRPWALYFQRRQNGTEVGPIKTAYDHLGWVVMHLAMGYTAGAWLGMSWANVATYIVSTWFLYPILEILVIFLFPLLPSAPKPKVEGEASSEKKKAE